MYSKPSIFKFDQTLQYMFVFKFQVRHAILDYREIASSNTSRAHADFFRLFMKGIFGPYVLWPLKKKLIFWIVTCVSARDYTVF